MGLDMGLDEACSVWLSLGEGVVPKQTSSYIQPGQQFAHL
jgi:hypothetical protein